MSDQNCFNCTGRLTKDVVKKTFPKSGKSFLEFDLANNTGYGEYASVQYFKCVLFGDKRADGLEPYLTKGKLVAVTGELETNVWTGKDGQRHNDWKLTVKNISLLGGGTYSQPEFFDEDELRANAQRRYESYSKPLSSKLEDEGSISF